jgi:hypothetical protein
MKTVLVCGGRDYRNYYLLSKALSGLPFKISKNAR